MLTNENLKNCPMRFQRAFTSVLDPERGRGSSPCVSRVFCVSCNLVALAPNGLAMASNQKAMAFNLLFVTFVLLVHTAHHLLATASNLRSWPPTACDDLQPKTIAINLLFLLVSQVFLTQAGVWQPLSNQYANR